MQILAANRLLQAAKASQAQSLAFLTELGFKGLSFKDSLENLIKFYYKSYDPDTLEKYLGVPTSQTPSNIKYDYRAMGVVSVWPNNKTVVLKNLAVAEIEDVEHRPTKDIEKTRPTVEPAPVKSPNNTSVKDDSHVPVTHISPGLEKQYKNIQGVQSRTAQMLFMKQLWIYLNETKFGGQMTIPKLELMKMQGTYSMRTLGRWWPTKDQLDMSPRLFNASQNFFVETFLHEMAHQAVTKIDKVRETVDGGHGPRWTNWMLKVGLNPSRYSKDDVTTYMTPKELQEHNQKKAEQQSIADKRAKNLKDLDLVTLIPREGLPATVLWRGDPYNGVLLGPMPKKVKGLRYWHFLKDDATKDLSKIILLPIQEYSIFRYQGHEDHNTSTWMHILSVLGTRHLGHPVSLRI